MKHRSLIIAAVGIAACTYNEFNTYNEVGADAGAGPSIVGQAGATGQVGNAGAGGRDASQAGSGGRTSNGGTAGDALGCSGCVRLSVLTGRSADYQREYSSRLDLSESLVTFRVRVRDYAGPVQLLMYVESDDHVPGGTIDEARYTSATLQADAGWQDVGIDLALIEPFRAPGFIDAGGSAGSGFDQGNPFDKSRVERIGLRVIPADGSGVLTPAILEIDGLSVSTPSGVSADFSADQAGFELVDEDSATVTHVP